MTVSVSATSRTPKPTLPRLLGRVDASGPGALGGALAQLLAAAPFERGLLLERDLELVEALIACAFPPASREPITRQRVVQTFA